MTESIVTRNDHQRGTFNDKEIKKKTTVVDYFNGIAPPNNNSNNRVREDFHRRTKEYEWVSWFPPLSSSKARDILEKANRVLNPESFFSPRFCCSLLYFLSSSLAAAEFRKAQSELLHWCKLKVVDVDVKAYEELVHQD